MNEKHTHVLFDFDGVIADTEHIAIKVQQMTCPDFTRADNQKKFEHNVFEWWEDPKAFSHNEQCRHDLFDAWGEKYNQLFKATAHPFPGSIRAVQDLSEHHQLSIISSSVSSSIVEFLTRYDAAHYFTDVLGSDVHAKKTEKINTILSRYGILMSDCVFVTDTLGDMREAEKAGIGIIAVSWGFNKREQLAKGSPFTIVDHPHELPQAVEKYFSNSSQIPYV